MSKRMMGSVIFAFVLGALFFAGTLLLSGTAIHSQKVEASAPGAAQAGANTAAEAKAAPNGSWADIAPFPTVSVSPTPGSYPLKLKRAGAAAYPPNGKIYVMGGRHGTDGEDVTLQWIWEYTPGVSGGSWVRKNALLDGSQPGSRYTANMAVATLTDTNGVRVYAIGGSSINSEPTPSVRIYDPNSDTLDVSSADPWPANPPRIPGGYAVYNNKLYIFGGFSAIGSGGVFTDTWVFDPMAAHGSQWSQLASANLGTARGYIAGAQLDGYIYAIGGDTWDSVNHTLLPVTNVERMDPRVGSPTWTTVASLPTARGDLGAWAYNTGTGYEISGRIAVAGGIYPTPDSTGYLYDPTTNSWGAFPSLVHATRNYGVAQMDGYLYAFGGYDYSAGIPAGANFNQRYDATQPIGTPTNTATGTPPTATSTHTSTSTTTSTSTPCSNNYASATATATIEPGTQDQSISCDDCVGTINLPFGFSFYDQIFSAINVSSNGNLQFNSQDSEYSNACLPAAQFDYAIMPYWDDLRTDAQPQCSAYPTGCGVFTSVSGSAPNRVFNVEWRAVLYSGGGAVNFEVRLYEGQSRFDIVYGALADSGTGATVGVQKDTGSVYYEFECNTGGLTQNLAIRFTATNCAPPTATSTSTVTSSPTATSTSTPTETFVPATNTVVTTPTDTRTPCTISFSDVHTTDYFYEPVRYLHCLGAISGYADGTFRPYANTTRSQVTKILVVAEGWAIDTTGGPHFSDVPASHPFYSWVETAYNHGVISGYSDGTFRPYNDVTRGQLSKIIVEAQAWTIDTTGGPHFSDVPTTDPFYDWIETAFHHQIISGYADGTFRPGNNATRGQVAKIVYNALTNP